MSIPLYSPEDVRKADERAIAAGVGQHVLMERAAGHLARGIVAEAGHGYGLEVAVLAGKGNNGGDGIAAARRLRAFGVQATVCLVEGEQGLNDMGKHQLSRWLALGGRVVDTTTQALDQADIAVDCLLGTGASGAPRGPIGEAVNDLNDSGTPIVACDVPTGVDADTGAVPGPAVKAAITVTLGAHKRGLWLWPARGHCGRVVLGNLGFTNELNEPSATSLTASDVRDIAPPSTPSAHKRTRGVVLIIAGSPNMSGAAALVARGSMAAGAGLVTVATPSLARHLVSPIIPEAMTLPLPDDDSDAAFNMIQSALEGVDAVAIGPGLGHDEHAVRLVRRIVAEIDLPTVLDADGINAFRRDGDALTDHASSMLVLTPHRTEFERVLGDTQLWSQRIHRVPEAARKWNATIVAKGPGSMIGAPDGRLWINATGTAALATGGTGDVLTGITATLIAQNPRPESVAAAVWLHGTAGECAEERDTSRPVTALDVARALPGAWRKVEQA